MYFDLNGNPLSFEIDEKSKKEIKKNIKDILETNFQYYSDDEFAEKTFIHFEKQLSKNNRSDRVKNYFADVEFSAKNDCDMGKFTKHQIARNLILARDAVIMLTIALKECKPNLSKQGYISYGTNLIVLGDEFIKRADKKLFKKDLSKFLDKTLSENNVQEFEINEDENLPNIEDEYYRD